MSVRSPALVLPLAFLVACGGAEADEASALAAAPFHVEVEGFATPESVLHDADADVYLVTNINGAPTDKDDNGFISRVGPDGSIQQLKWIDGEAAEVVLHAPKGMALKGDTLYVADIDCVKRFLRTTGAPAGEICFPGATFLNDVATDADGVLHVTDSGFTPTFAASGTDAVWRFDPSGAMEKLHEGDELGRPNGIAFGPQGGYVVTFGSGEIYQLGEAGARRTILPGAPDRALDGIHFLPDGGYLFSSWGDAAVHRVDADGATRRVLDSVDAPADIGYDAARHRVLVPLFNQNRVIIHELEAPAAAVMPGGGY